MRKVQAQFRYGDSDMPGSPSFVADVPSGIDSKAALLDELYHRLRFPEYFGGNWDALEECIRDLSWLPPGPIVLKHRDLPLAADVANLRTYVSILSDAIEEPSGMTERSLVVVFPPEAREIVDRLLR